MDRGELRGHRVDSPERMNKYLSIIQDWLYPPTCLLCGDPGTPHRDLCGRCAAALPYQEVACLRCGETLSNPAPECGRCQRHPPAFDSTTAIFRYEEPIRHLLHALKFSAQFSCARLLGTLMAERLAADREKPRRLIPVPLHASRYRQRGFNQSTEIARTISRRLNIPLALRCCARVRSTPPQTELTAKRRQNNLKDAFQVLRAPGADHVAIVDDIITTGATVNELARVLRTAGVRRIDVWACARA
jgi:ComF family protein